ncbi:hypothetical protein PUR61_15935, partial [Streptomyces sp. BE20]|uniref:hypothetical protein n=1 Tax=Streptomyces sp. BE20 TaxID=3002525 RepID=UPI002E7F32F1|nr:hypothetical protein [Streptomyces sp. BE20]
VGRDAAPLPAPAEDALADLSEGNGSRRWVGSSAVVSCDLVAAVTTGRAFAERTSVEVGKWVHGR